MEDEILIKNLPVMGMEVSKLLPKRSLMGIAKRINRLSLDVPGKRAKFTK